MELVLALTLLALHSAHTASLPDSTLGPQVPIESLDAADILDAPALLDDPAMLEGRVLDADIGRAVDAPDRDLELLIGKDVKQALRREGLSDGKPKDFRRREQHKDLESHLIDSHEWAHEDSEIDDILDHESVKGLSDGKPKIFRRREHHKDLESRLIDSDEWSHEDSEIDDILDHESVKDPDYVVLKEAIAQIFKEVANSEGRRKKKQHLNSKHKNIKVSSNNEKKKQNKKINQQDEVKISKKEFVLSEGLDDFSDSIDDFDDAEYHSSSMDIDGILKSSEVNLDDFIEEDDEYFEDSVSHEENKVPKRKEHHYYNQSKRYPKKQDKKKEKKENVFIKNNQNDHNQDENKNHNDHTSLVSNNLDKQRLHDFKNSFEVKDKQEDKTNHYKSHESHVSKELLENVEEDAFENDDEQFENDINYSGNSDIYASKESETDLDESKSEKDTENQKESRNQTGIEDVTNSKHGEHVVKNDETQYDDHQSDSNNLSVEESQIFEEFKKNKIDESRQEDENYIVDRKGKKNKHIPNYLTNLNIKNHDKNHHYKNNHENGGNPPKNQQDSFGNVDEPKPEDKNENKQSKDREEKNNEEFKDQNDEKNNRDSHNCDKKIKLENKNDLSPKVRHENNGGAKRYRQYDSLEISKYPNSQKRYRSKKLKFDKIGNRYPEASGGRSPMKSYTLSFFFKK